MLLHIILINSWWLCYFIYFSHRSRPTNCWNKMFHNTIRALSINLFNTYLVKCWHRHGQWRWSSSW